MAESLPPGEVSELEIWEHFAHGEPKEFHSLPPTGLIRPKPVRPRAIISCCDEDLSSSKPDSSRHSLFLSVAREPIPNIDTFTAEQEITSLIKRLQLKENEIKFQKLQRASASEREEVLLERVDILMEEVDSSREEMEQVLLYAQTLQLENDRLQRQVRQLLSDQNFTPRTHVSRLVQTTEVKRPETGGGGEGVRIQLTSPLDRRSTPEPTTLYPTDTSEYRMSPACFVREKLSLEKEMGPKGLSICDVPLGHCPFVSPVKYNRTCLTNSPENNIAGIPEKVSEIAKSSNEKVPRSLTERLRVIFTRLKG